MFASALIIICLSLPSSLALKILGYAPIAFHSHANFIGKVADVLSEASHEVVLLSPVFHSDLPRKVSRHARFIHFHNESLAREFTDYMGIAVTFDLWTADNTNILANIRPFYKMTAFRGAMCESMVVDKGLLKQLRDEKFDVAFAEGFEKCAFALFHLTGITKFAATNSLSVIDAWEHVTGVPHFTSYVPGIFSSSSDRMTFFERAKNTFDAFIFRRLHTAWEPTQTALRRRHHYLPLLDDIIARCSYFFVNTDPLMDFPRLVTRKMIDIGGISVPDKHLPVGEPFASWMTERKQTVLISFGTIMLSFGMPSAFKASILDTARAMPNVTFIWKYEKEEDNISDGIPSLHTTTWLPQSDMLKDTRLSLFVTHGGLGSTTEATFSGVPLVVLPVMGDQMRNGQIVKRLGTGRLLHRDELGEAGKLEEAVREVLEKDEYKIRAKKIAKMLAAQPHPVRERLVSHFEFMAAHGPLDILDHAGRTMGYVELFNLDVITAAAAVIMGTSFITFFLLFKIFIKIIGIFTLAKKKVE